MAKIYDVERTTEERFVNLYRVRGVNPKGHHSNYLVASRAKTIDDLKISTRKKALRRCGSSPRRM